LLAVMLLDLGAVPRLFAALMAFNQAAIPLSPRDSPGILLVLAWFLTGVVADALLARQS